MKYNFDKTINRSLTYSYRWYVNEGELPLNIADMDFEVLPEIKKAIQDRAELDCYGYIRTPIEYFEAYAYWWKLRHDTYIDTSWCAFSLSVVGSIDTVLKHFSHKHDAVVMFTPIYNVFFNCIKNNDLVLKECPFILKDNAYEIDWTLLEDLLKLKETRFFIFCNPHNPVGRRFSIEEVDRLIELCQKYDVFLLSDEIHADLDFNKDRYVPVYKSELSNYEKLIVFLSPGKVFNVAGLQSSIVVCKNKDLLQQIEQYLYMDDIGGANYFSIDPVIAAFRNGERYVEELNSYLNENKAYLIDFLSTHLPNLKLVGGEMTYLMWIDVSAYSQDSRRFTLELRNKTGLVVAPGINYGREGFIRLNIATPRKYLIDALNRLEKFILEQK